VGDSTVNVPQRVENLKMVVAHPQESHPFCRPNTTWDGGLPLGIGVLPHANFTATHQGCSIYKIVSQVANLQNQAFKLGIPIA
jgi:hypothetical protein